MGRPPIQVPDDVIAACSGVIPTVILAKLYNCSELTIAKRRARLGLALSAAESKHLTASFLAQLPDIKALPLSREQKVEVRILRQEWLLRRKGDLKREERQHHLVVLLNRKLPRTAIAAVATLSTEKVGRIERELGIVSGRSEQRRLEHRFSSNRCPLYLSDLTKGERIRLRDHWELKSKAYERRIQRRLVKSEQYLAGMLHRLDARRQEVLSQSPDTAPFECHGDCERDWPRTTDFFPALGTAPDGLALRCRYCAASRRTRVRLGQRGRRTGRDPRLASAEERERLVKVIRDYSSVIPSSLLRDSLRVRHSSFAVLRSEAEVKLAGPERKAVFWGYFFDRTVPELPLLSDSESARLSLLTGRFRRRVERSFQRSERLALQLANERERLRLAAVEEHRALAERLCSSCKQSLPLRDLFFPPRFINERIAICRVCADLAQRRKRRHRLEVRYGGGTP